MQQSKTQESDVCECDQELSKPDPRSSKDDDECTCDEEQEQAQSPEESTVCAAVEGLKKQTEMGQDEQECACFVENKDKKVSLVKKTSNVSEKCENNEENEKVIDEISPGQAVQPKESQRTNRSVKFPIPECPCGNNKTGELNLVNQMPQIPSDYIPIQGGAASQVTTISNVSGLAPKRVAKDIVVTLQAGDKPPKQIFPGPSSVRTSSLSVEVSQIKNQNDEVSGFMINVKPSKSGQSSQIVKPIEEIKETKSLESSPGKKSEGSTRECSSMPEVGSTTKEEAPPRKETLRCLCGNQGTDLKSETVQKLSVEDPRVSQVPSAEQPRNSQAQSTGTGRFSADAARYSQGPSVGASSDFQDKSPESFRASQAQSVGNTCSSDVPRVSKVQSTGVTSTSGTPCASQAKSRASETSAIPKQEKIGSISPTPALDYYLSTKKTCTCISKKPEESPQEKKPYQAFMDPCVCSEAKKAEQLSKPTYPECSCQYEAFKKDPVMAAVQSYQAEMKPLKEALNQLREKIRSLNLPETNALVAPPFPPPAMEQDRYGGRDSRQFSGMDRGMGIYPARPFSPQMPYGGGAPCSTPPNFGGGYPNRVCNFIFPKHTFFNVFISGFNWNNSKLQQKYELRFKLPLPRKHRLSITFI